jgi:hypothetical protein
VVEEGPRALHGPEHRTLSVRPPDETFRAAIGLSRATDFPPTN